MKQLFICFLLFCSSLWADDWHRVFLATYPRSGNHWVRYLIEDATHIATSSVYKDREPKHLRTLFPWGGYCADHGYRGNCRYPEMEDPVIIKTHFPAVAAKKNDHNPPERVIRIVRHPIDSIYSYYVRLYDELPKGKTMPEKHLQHFVHLWKKFENYWNRQENVLTIRYEDLLNDPHHYLSLILEFAGYEFTENDIKRAVAKNPPIGGPLKHRNHFSKKDLKYIERKLGHLMSKHDYHI